MTALMRGMNTFKHFGCDFFWMLCIKERTFDVEIDGIAFTVSLFIAADACINTATCTCHILQYQTLIGHCYACHRIAVQNFTL